MQMLGMQNGCSLPLLQKLALSFHIFKLVINLGRDIPLSPGYFF